MIDKDELKIDENKFSDGKHDKDRKSLKNIRDKIKPITKIIVRHLPPSMTEDTFMKQIDPLPEHDYFYYVPADWSLGQNASCRAYINFINQDDIFIFKDKFDGYVFVDTKGIEYSAIVEFAPFQGLPKSRARKKDNKSNTIETDQHYINFIESLNNELNDIGKGESKLEYSYSLTKDDKKITKTPLLEFLANKKQERRDERKRRIDERKRQRDEDRQRKKQNIVKNIPSVIQEERSKILVNEDNIMVRTIKSRLDRNRSSSSNSINNSNVIKRDRVFESKASSNTNLKSGGNSNSSSSQYDDSRKSYKDYKEERQRKRDEQRRKEWDQRKKDSVHRKSRDRNDFEKELENVTIISKNDEKSSLKLLEGEAGCTSSIIEPSPKEIQVKREIKKYSEVRKERRALLAQTATAVQTDKKTQPEVEQTSCDVVDSVSNSTKNIEQDSSNKHSSHNKEEIDEVDSMIMPARCRLASKLSEYEREVQQREIDERTARRIRNKDRPSIQIYRPGGLKAQKSKPSSGDDEKIDQKDSPDSGNEKPMKTCNLSRRSSSSSKSVADDKEDRRVELVDAGVDVKKVYEMSPDIAPFIPKSMQIKVVEVCQSNDPVHTIGGEDIGPGE